MHYDPHILYYGLHITVLWPTSDVALCSIHSYLLHSNASLYSWFSGYKFNRYMFTKDTPRFVFGFSLRLR